MLHIQLHGRKWILDLMGNLLGHLPPGRFTLRLCQQSGTPHQFIDHVVVFIHQPRYLIFSPVHNLLIVLAQAELGNPALDKPQRLCNAISKKHTHKQDQ